MRDALSLTDQAIGHGGGKINEADVSAMLGTIERNYVIDICRALSSGSGPDVLAAIARMAEQTPDYESALADILSIWHQVAIVQTVPEALDKGVANYSDLLALAAEVSREDVQLLYQICLLGRKDLKLSEDLRSGFEMVMLRALAFRPQTKPQKKSQKKIEANNSVTPAPPEVEPEVKKPEPAVAESSPPWAANTKPLVNSEPVNKEPSAALIKSLQRLTGPSAAMTKSQRRVMKAPPKKSLQRLCKEPSASCNEEPQRF